MLVLFAVNPLPTGGFPYKRSIVRNFVVWLMLFALLVERWCFIKAFRIAGKVYGVSISSHWTLLTIEAKLCCLLSCLSKQAVEQTVDMHVKTEETQIMLLLCNVSFCNGWTCVRWNQWSPVDSLITGASWNPANWNPMTRMRCHCYVSLRHSVRLKNQDNYVAIILKV